VKDQCNRCLGINICLTSILEKRSVDCKNFDELCNCVNETLERFNALGLPNLLSFEEKKELVYCIIRRTEMR